MLCCGVTEHRDAIEESFRSKESPGKRTASTLANDTSETLPCHLPQTHFDFSCYFISVLCFRVLFIFSCIASEL